MIRCPDCGSQNIDGAEDCESCAAPLASLSLPRPAKGLSEKILNGTLRDLKPVPAVTASPDAPLREAIAAMRAHKVGCLLVSSGGKLAGIVTERDLLEKVAGIKPVAELKVRDVMCPDPVMLRLGHPVAFAFHQMAVGGHRHLPVLMEDGSIGMLSSRDLLRYLS